MKLPRALVSLTGPTCKPAQQQLLSGIKQAFRERIEQRRAPIEATINTHLRSSLLAGSPPTTIDRYRSLPAEVASQKSYINGYMDRALVYELIGRSTSLRALKTITHYATKSGISLSESDQLSARYAARLIHLGDRDTAATLAQTHMSSWVIQPRVQATCIHLISQLHGLKSALRVYDQALETTSDSHHKSLVRALLREAIRHNNLQVVRDCLRKDISACVGQETGLSKWLCERSDPTLAFSVLVRAEPSRAREAAVGLDIARRFLEVNDLVSTQRVVSWVQQRFALSIQSELRMVEAELKRRMGRIGGAARGVKEVGSVEIAVE